MFTLRALSVTALMALALPLLASAATCTPTPRKCPTGQLPYYYPSKSTQCPNGGYLCQKSTTAAPSKPAASLAKTAPTTASATLAFGSRGTAVTTLQQQLVTLGYLTADSATGYFGNLTRAAVRKFQCDKLKICSGSEASNGWGSVGPKTRTVLASAMPISSGGTKTISTISSYAQATYGVQNTYTQGDYTTGQTYSQAAYYSQGSYATSDASCVPASPATETRTRLCPSGQTGSITETRTSSCSTGATSPTWSAWTNLSNSCTTQTSTYNEGSYYSQTSYYSQAAYTPAVSYAPIDTTIVKNLLIYQPGGWTGIDADTSGDFEWPAYGGKSAYIARSSDILRHQIRLIGGLGSSVAISVLLMNDEDAGASGYGTCWNGSWNGQPDRCETGTYTRPYAMFDHVREAARIEGVRYAPEFSIMNYAHQGQGEFVLPALQQAINWWRTRLPDEYAAKTADGRYYVVVDGLPELVNLSNDQKNALIAYMRSQSDLFWIDNLVNAENIPGAYTGNIVRSAAADDGAQSYLNSMLGSGYRWWFRTNNVTRTYAGSISPSIKIPEETRLKWLNISPDTGQKWPIGISQWNEYAEYLIFEPSTRSGTSNYDYLKWRLSQQP